MGTLSRLGLDDRRKVYSQAMMESHGKEPSEDLLRELREALDKDNQAADARREEDRRRMTMSPPAPPPGQPK